MAGSGAKVFLDIMPRLGQGELDNILKGVAGKVGNFSGNLNRQLGSSIGTGMSTAVDREQAKITASMKTAQANVSRSLDSIARAQDAQVTSLTRYRAAQRAYAEQMAAGYEEGSSRAISALARVQAAQQKYEASLRNTKQAASDHVAATAAMNEANRDQAAYDARQSAGPSAATIAATRVMTGAVIGLGAAYAYGVDQAANLDQKMKLIETSAGETGGAGAISMLKQRVLDLQAQWGYSASSIADALRSIEQAGYHGADAAKVLTTAVEGAHSENANLNDVAKQVTTTMHDFNFAVNDSNAAMSKSVEAVSLAKTNLTDYSEAVGQVEKSAQQAGVSIDDMNAALAMSTQHGSTIQDAANTWSHAIQTMSNMQSPQLATMNQLGFTQSSIQAMMADPNMGVTGTMEAVQKAIMSRVGADGKVHMGTAAHNADAQKAANEMYSSMNATDRAIVDQFKTSGTQSADSWGKLISHMSAPDQALLRQWKTVQDKANGFSAALKKGLPDDLSVEQAMKLAFGDMPTLSAAQAVVTGVDPKTGKPNDNYEETLKKVGLMRTEAGNDANGGVKGSAESQNSLKAQLANLRGSFSSLVTSIGESGQGPLTDFVKALTSATQWLRQHQGVMETLMYAAGGAAAALLIVKGLNVAGNLLTGNAWGTQLSTGAFNLTRKGVKGAAAGIGKGGAIGYNYAASYGPEVAAIAEGAKEGVASGLSAAKGLMASGLLEAKEMTMAGGARAAEIAANPGILALGADAARTKAGLVAASAAQQAREIAAEPGILMLGADAARTKVATSKTGGRLRALGGKLSGLGGRFGAAGMAIAGIGLPMAMMMQGSGNANAAEIGPDGQPVANQNKGIDWAGYAMDAAMVAPAVPMAFSAAKSVGKGAMAAGKAVSDFGGGAAEKAASSIGKATQAVKEFNVGEKLVQGATKAWEVAQIALNVVLDANPIGLIVTAIAALVAGVIYAYTHFQTFRDIVNDCWDWIKKFASWIGSEFKKLWTDTFDFLKQLWSDIHDKVFKFYIDEVKSYLSAFIDYFKGIGKGIGDVLSGIKDLFSGNVSGIKKIWDGLKEIAAAPVRFIIETVYNNGIVKLWNGVAGVFGMKGMQLKPISFNADGGGIAPVEAAGGTVLPGYTPGRDSIPAVLSPGEGVAVPELVQAIGPGNFMALNRKYSKGRPSANEKAGLPIPHADGGGIFGDIGNAAKGAWNFAKEGGKILASPLTWIKSQFDGLIQEATGFAGQGNWRDAIVNFPKSVLDGVIDWVTKHIGLGGKGGSGRPGDTPVTAGANARQWRSLAMQALVDEGFTPPGQYIDAMIAQIQTESSGDPNIYQQIRDVNSGGNEAAGLLQVTPGTFEQYRDPNDPDNRLDPKANMDAALRYMRGRYHGDINGVWGHGHGYSGGGIALPFDGGGIAPPGNGAIKDNWSKPNPSTRGGRFPSIGKNSKQKNQADTTAIDRAWAWIQSVAGTPYEYGNLDCSGFLSGVYDALLDNPIARAFTTVSDFPSLGFRQGLGGIFSIGVNPKPGEQGHMAGTFNGHRIESGGSHGNIAIDGPAVGADDPQFSDHWYLPGSMFVPAYTGKGASTLTAQGKMYNQGAAAKKKAESKRQSAQNYQAEAKKAKDEAAADRQKAQQYLAQAAEDDKKAQTSILDTEKAAAKKAAEKARQSAASANSRAAAADARAEKYANKANTANSEARNYDTQANTYTNRANKGETGDNSGNNGTDSTQPHLLTPVEFGQQAGGVLVSGLLETFGLNNTVFADPNQSPYFRIADAIYKSQYGDGSGSSTSGSGGQGSDDPSNGDYSDTSDYSADDSTDSYDPSSDLPSPGDYLNTTTPTISPDPSADDPAGQAKSDLANGAPPDKVATAPNPQAPAPAPAPPNEKNTVLPTLYGNLPGVGDITPTKPAPQSTYGSREPGWGGTPPVVPKPSPQSEQLLSHLLGVPTHDQGGWLREGLSIVNNLTGRPEPVFNPGQWDLLKAAANNTQSGAADGDQPKALVHIENQTIHGGDEGKAAREIVREMNRYRRGAR